MIKQLEKARIELEKISLSVLSGIKIPSSNNPIDELKYNLIKLQKFLEIFPIEATDLSNNLLLDFEKQFGEKPANEFKEKLIEVSQLIIFDVRDKMFKV